MIRYVRALTVVGLLAGFGFVLAPANAITAYSVSSAITKARVDLGGGATLSGSVYPAAPGRSVTVQVKQPGEATWETLRTVTLSSASKYSTVVRPTRAGVTSYRVRKAASSVRSTGTSVTRTLTAWRWRLLGRIPAGSGPASGGFTQNSGMYLQHLLFRPVFVQTPGAGTAYGDRFFGLGGRCTKLDAWVSATYDSADDDPIDARILGDTMANPGAFTVEVAHNIVHRLGDPAHIYRYFELTGVDNLNLSISSVGTGDKVVWGRPMVYCKF